MSEPKTSGTNFLSGMVRFFCFVVIFHVIGEHYYSYVLTWALIEGGSQGSWHHFGSLNKTHIYTQASLSSQEDEQTDNRGNHLVDGW